MHENGKREWLRADRATLSRSIFRLEVGLPSQRLRAMQILDLPGLADPRFSAPVVDIAYHDVDAVVWCTMSTQAWKESERIAWGQLPARLSSRGLLASTHGDLLHDERDMKSCWSACTARPAPSSRSIMPISTVDALALMRRGSKGWTMPRWKASGADALEMRCTMTSCLSVRKQRAEAALRMTGRIAHRALVAPRTAAEHGDSIPLKAAASRPARLCFPQPHEMSADDGGVGVGLLQLLQTSIYGGDELRCLGVLSGHYGVHAARAERPFRHLEMLRQSQSVEHISPFEIVGDERRRLRASAPRWRNRAAWRGGRRATRFSESQLRPWPLRTDTS